MNPALLGLIISGSSIVVLLALFHFEARRGVRIAEGLRELFDRVVLSIERVVGVVTGYIGRDLLRQSMHYFFHTLLSGMLSFLHQCEERVQHMLRSNRVLAKRARGERTTRNKLDEIAEHKASIALSESEKKQHREDTLSGKI